MFSPGGGGDMANQNYQKQLCFSVDLGEIIIFKIRNYFILDVSFFKYEK